MPQQPLSYEKESDQPDGFQVSDSPMCVIGRDGQFKRANEALQEATGYCEEELLSSSYLKLVHPEDAEATSRVIQESPSSETAQRLENRIRCKNNSYKCFSWSLRPVKSGTLACATVGSVARLKLIAEAMREGEDSFRELAETMRTVFWVGSPDWNEVYYVSPAYEELWGRPRQSLYDRPRSWLDAVVEEDRPRIIAELNKRPAGDLSDPKFPEYRIVRPDGSVRWILARSFPLRDESGQVYRIAGIAEDITERKRAEECQGLITRLLEELNRPGELLEVARTITGLIRDFLDVEAVGIRLREGEDFPYFVTEGFPECFVEAENYLCSRAPNGRITRDEQGSPYLECMCGNILSGRTDPSKPFFTEDGSFWTNSTTELLAGTCAKDRLARTRNRCNTAGYESVALIPIRAGGQIPGLVQLNDTRRNCFTQKVIQFLEHAAASIGMAICRREAEESLRESESKFRTLFHQAADGVVLVDPATLKLVDFNDVACQNLGFTREEFGELTVADLELARRRRLIRNATQGQGRPDPRLPDEDSVGSRRRKTVPAWGLERHNGSQES
ncbi:MAG: PAS domain S-box protein [Planctomycetota bacterium]|jgi:PAS domain S-box-containing protein